MSDRSSTPSKKRGLYGWRAFFAVFGCGTLAALLVVGLVVGSVRMLASSFTGGDTDQAGADPVPSRKPVTSMTPGALNLCQLVGDAPPVSITERMDNGGGPKEKGVKDKSVAWIVSDECQWEMIGENSATWILDLSYKSFISSGNRKERFSATNKEFENQKKAGKEKFAKIESRDAPSDVPGDTYALYGRMQSGETGYLLVVKIKSTVYTILMTDPGEPSEKYSASAFRGKAKSVALSMEYPLESVVPD